MQASQPIEPGGPRILVIDGSPRPASYTSKACALVMDEFAGRRVPATLLHAHTLALPWPGSGLDSPGALTLREQAQAASAIVLATPEYHGSFSSLMKLTIENLGFPSMLAGKPISLLGVAAGGIGAIKSLEHLRGVCAHVGAIVMPLPTSIAFVQKVFDAEGRCLDAGAERLLRGVASALLDYLTRSVCPAITLERLLRENAATTTAG